MQNLREAFQTARRYEQYQYTRINARGYSIWAALTSLGSLLSFFIVVFGEAHVIDDGVLSAGIGALWSILVATGILVGFQSTPEILSDKEINQDDQPTTKIWLGWLIAYTIGIGVSMGLNNILSISNPELVGVSLSLGLGNLATYLVVRGSNKEPLVISTVILLSVPFIALTSSPYNLLVFGFGISFPYYVISYYLYNIKIPKLFRQGSELV